VNRECGTGAGARAAAGTGHAGPDVAGHVWSGRVRAMKADARLRHVAVIMLTREGQRDRSIVVWNWALTTT